MCEKNVLADSECIQHFSIPKSEASVLIDLTTKSAKKLVVEPSASVGLGLCSAAIHDISNDSLSSLRERVETVGWSDLPKSRTAQ